MFSWYNKLLENPRWRYWIKEWIEPVIIALILATFIKIFFVQAFKIPSGSMRMTLVEGDRILVNKLIYRLRDPKRGEVVVFRYPAISFFQYKDFIDKDPYPFIDAVKKVISGKRYPYSMRDFNDSLDGLNDMFYSNVPFEILKYDMKYKLKNREARGIMKKIEKRYEKPFSELTYEELKVVGESSYGKRLKRLILEERFGELCPKSDYKKERKRDFIKRLIGLPGETLEIRDGNVYINGKIITKPEKIRENYYYNKEDWRYGKSYRKIHIPEGEYFVLGDNSGNSSDSRNWGFVEREDFLGKAICIYWPLKRWRKIE